MGLTPALPFIINIDGAESAIRGFNAGAANGRTNRDDGCRKHIGHRLLTTIPAVAMLVLATMVSGH